MLPIKNFISSVQAEFAAERRMLADYLSNDAMFRKFCDVFIFEDIPAQDRRADDLYMVSFLLLLNFSVMCIQVW
jgi:ATP-dependent DNA helicase RecG